MVTKPARATSDRFTTERIFSARLRYSAATGAMIIVASLASKPAIANTVEIDGAPAPDNSPVFICVNRPDAEQITIAVDESDLDRPADLLPCGGAAVLAYTAVGNINFQLDEEYTVTAESGVGVDLFAEEGDVNATVNGHIDARRGLLVRAGRGLVINGSGSISAGPSESISAVSLNGGYVEVSGLSTIDGFLRVSAGGEANVNLSNIGSINADSRALQFSLGTADLTVRNVGPIVSGEVGVLVRMSDGRAVLQLSDVTSVSDGLNASVGDADIEVVIAGTVTSDRMGAWLRSSGNISVSGGSTGEVFAEADGGFNRGLYADATGEASVLIRDLSTVSGRDIAVLASTEAGDISISGLADVRSEGVAIDARTSSGNISIQGNGLANGISAINEGLVDGIQTTAHGIFARSDYGTIDIGSETPNGTIAAMSNGIEAVTFGSGNITIRVGDDIEAGFRGIYGRTINGQVDVLVDENATVAGGFEGIYINDAASASVRIASGAEVNGGRAGIWLDNTSNWTVEIAEGAKLRGSTGLIAGSANGSDGTGTVVNRGLISATSRGDLEAEFNGPALTLAPGEITVENFGEIRGAIRSGPAQGPPFGEQGLSLLNRETGLWIPDRTLQSSSFRSLQDLVQNFGEIRLLEGTIYFDNLETFTNESGGLINMSQGSGSLDWFQALSIAPKDGSVFRFDFNALADPNFIDGGKTGTADSIVVSEAAPTGVSLIDIVDHTPSGAVPLTGSAALIYTGTVLDAPDPGAVLESSRNYAFGEVNPTTDTRLFTLVDDGSGGVFLQWQPNLSSKSLGAYLGEDLANPASEAAPLARVSSAFGGLDRLYSGGGDSLFGDAYNLGSEQCRSGWSAWSAVDGQSLDFDSVGELDSNALRLGIGKDLSGLVGGSCGQLAIGLFAQFSESESVSELGRVEIESSGGGVYLAAELPLGLDAEAVIAAVNGQQDVANDVFTSSGQQDFDGMLVSGSIGRAFSVSDRGQVETSLFGSLAQLDADPFVDSAGIEIDRTETDSWLAGARLGYRHQLSPAWQAEAGIAAYTEDGDIGISAFERAMDAQFSEEHLSLDGTLRYAFEDGAGNLFLGARGEQSASSSGGRLTVGLRRVF